MTTTKYLLPPRYTLDLGKPEVCEAFERALSAVPSSQDDIKKFNFAEDAKQLTELTVDDAIDKKKYTFPGVAPLFVAAMVGNIDYMRAVLNDNKSSNENTSSSVADAKNVVDSKSSSHGSASSTTDAAAAAAKFHAPRANGDKTIAEFAARAGCVEALRFLREEAKVSVDEANALGNRPIMYAVGAGSSIDATQYLHEVAGVSLSFKGPCNDSLLHIVAKRGDLELVEYLLSQPDSEINMEQRVKTMDAKGKVVGTETAFTAACRAGHLNIARALYRAGAHKGTLQEAKDHAQPLKIVLVTDEEAKSGDLDEGKTFMRFKHFPPLPGSAVTPELRSRAAGGKPEAVYRSSRDGKRNEANAPLHEAAGHGRLEVVRFLIEEAGFAIDKDVVVGARTPLLMATRNKHNKVVEYLVQEAKCDLNIKGSDGSFALYTASYQNNLPLIEFLLAHGANSSFEWCGATAFFAAVSQNKVDSARKLYECKADVTSMFQGRSPLQYAREKQLKDMLRFLEENQIY